MRTGGGAERVDAAANVAGAVELMLTGDDARPRARRPPPHTATGAPAECAAESARHEPGPRAGPGPFVRLNCWRVSAAP
jgi:hypothetical protein